MFGVFTPLSLRLHENNVRWQFVLGHPFLDHRREVLRPEPIPLHCEFHVDIFYGEAKARFDNEIPKLHKVAGTIADLEARKMINAIHINEALVFRHRETNDRSAVYATPVSSQRRAPRAG